MPKQHQQYIIIIMSAVRWKNILRIDLCQVRNICWVLWNAQAVLLFSYLNQIYPCFGHVIKGGKCNGFHVKSVGDGAYFGDNSITMFLELAVVLPIGQAPVKFGGR